MRTTRVAQRPSASRRSPACSRPGWLRRSPVWSWTAARGGRCSSRAFALLRAVPLFAPLSIAALENLSRRLAELPVPAGEAVVREGEPGDRLYVIAEGDFDVVSAEGAFPSLADGEVFGEIALLRDVPRTATVTARTDAVVFALDRDAFLTAVGGHRYCARSADTLIAERTARQPAARAV
jgi:CRP-like cAMP-binding protein